jgi:diguanylate cyclase (GGDEF)-like protein
MHSYQARIWIAALTFVAIVSAASIIELVRSYRSYIQVAYTEVDLSGFFVSEWVSESFDGIEAILRDVLYNINEDNIDASLMSPTERREKNEQLFFKSSHYENIIFIGIFDPDCVIQYGSVFSIVGDSSRDLGRDYCDDAFEPPFDKIKFSDLFLSSTGELNVSVTRPILTAENKVIGFSLAGLNLSFFQKWLNSIDNPAISISIIDFNRILLARKPHSLDIGEPVRDEKLQDFIEAPLKAVTFRLKSPVDGIERLWSLRKIHDFPYLVAVGYELETVLSPWRTKVFSYVLGNLLLATVSFFLALAYSKNSNNARCMEELAMRDPLTALLNRRSFNKLAKSKLEEDRKNKRPATFVMIDVDHFKRVNDTMGHDTGDEILKRIAAVVRASFRASDLACRWGGEEFVVYLSDTDLDLARTLAERLRINVMTSEQDDGVTVTVSQGLASPAAQDAYDQVLKRADTKLYEAKAAGRNCIRA